MTVLLIDDDEEDQEAFCDAVKAIDPEIQCLTARDGESGIKLLSDRSKLPDYVFLDINMPKMDGRKCLQEIRKNSILKEIAVVMYSTSLSPQDV